MTFVEMVAFYAMAVVSHFAQFVLIPFGYELYDVRLGVDPLAGALYVFCIVVLILLSVLVSSRRYASFQPLIKNTVFVLLIIFALLVLAPLALGTLMSVVVIGLFGNL